MRSFVESFLTFLLLALPTIDLVANFITMGSDLEIISVSYSPDTRGQEIPPDPASALKGLSFSQLTSLDHPLQKGVWDHWLVITCHNPSSEPRNFTFDFENWAWVNLYEMTDDGSYPVQKTGKLIPYGERNVQYTNHCMIKLRFDSSETKSLLIHLRSTINYLQVPSDLRFNVLSEEKFNAKVQMTSLWFGMFIGFYLIMLLYNLFIYLSTRDRNYVPYLLALVASLIITIHLFGYFVPIFRAWEGYVHVHSKMQFYSSMLIGWAMLAFTARFLNVGKRYPHFYTIMKILAVLITFLPLPALLGYASINEKISGLLGIITMLVILTIAVKSRMDNYPSSGLFLMGYGAFAIGIGVMLCTFLNILPNSLQNLYPVNIGSTIEMVFFSLALGNRINILARDNAYKQMQIIEQLREKEELQTHITRDLERNVAERTKEIQIQKQEIERQKINIEAEKEKVDNLLLNILPARVAQELQQNGRATPRYFENVTVLFADLVSFTRKSAGLRPELIIDDLDHCFRSFDEIIDKYQIEKIKTIGDGYMCAAGVPLPMENSGRSMLLAALEIRAFLDRWAEEKISQNQVPWQVRIGIHTGEVVAGIVGKRKFAYDIWGGTVNTASRVEEACEPDKINISGETYAMIKDEFVTTYRGNVQTQENDIDMYYVIAKK